MSKPAIPRNEDKVLLIVCKKLSLLARFYPPLIENDQPAWGVRQHQIKEPLMAIWKDDQSAQPPPPPRSRLAEFIYRIRQDLKQQGEDPDFALEPQELGNGDYLTVGALVYHIIWS